MIESNKIIFASLDVSAKDQGAVLENESQPRWIATDAIDKRILKECRLVSVLQLSATKIFARFDIESRNLFCAVGFDDRLVSSWLIPVDVGPGLLTAVLSELNLRPVASGLQIKQVVDAQDRRDVGYQGHSGSDISGLFPAIRAFEGCNVEISESSKIAFDILLTESRLSSNWIDKELADDLRHLLDLDKLGIPFSMLARSLLDFDRSSLFMALYRCLEALYAHSGAMKLQKSLDIQKPWREIAVALENDLSWRPFDSRSLESLVKMGPTSDVEKIVRAISPAFPGECRIDIFEAATDYLYKLRNAVVHFRPVHSEINFENVDWKDLCRTCTTLIWYVYSSITSK